LEIAMRDINNKLIHKTIKEEVKTQGLKVKKSRVASLVYAVESVDNDNNIYDSYFRCV